MSILARVRNRGVQEKKKRKRIYGKGIIFIYCSTDQSCFRMHKEHDHNLYFGRESCRSATLILVGDREYCLNFEVMVIESISL